MLKILVSEKRDEPTIATIGNFDGIHIGHKALLSELNKPNYWRVVIVFDKPPNEYLGFAKPVLGLLRDKIFALKTSSLVDEIVVLHFNKYIAELTPDEFIQKYLIEKLNISSFIVGKNFRFGQSASGNISNFNNYNINTSVFNKLCIDGEVVSSSLVRKYAEKQNLQKIKFLLGKNITYTSRVIKGNQLARKLGMPTINLSMSKSVPALHGIYTSHIYIANCKYNGITSIGTNPTVNNSVEYKIETYIFDIDEDFYGQIATIELLHFIRNERCFSSLELLSQQMKEDLSTAKSMLKTS